jgi:FKBP-type peptidyl-prolyl cis-trans isomerase
MKALSFVLAAVVAMAVSACGGNNTTPTAPSANVPFSTTDLRVGTGAEATLGRSVTVNYSLWLWDSLGTDNKGSRIDAGTSFPFVVGQGVIQGFSQGTIGMRVGGLRRVVVPPSLGYGSAGQPPVPGNATLIFEIELLSVQ